MQTQAVNDAGNLLFAVFLLATVILTAVLVYRRLRRRPCRNTRSRDRGVPVRLRGYFARGLLQQQDPATRSRNGQVFRRLVRLGHRSAVFAHAQRRCHHEDRRNHATHLQSRPRSRVSPLPAARHSGASFRRLDCSVEFSAARVREANRTSAGLGKAPGGRGQLPNHGGL